MPFDGTTFEIDLRQPSLRALSAVLRDPTLWPTGFTWDYRYGCSCALGLAARLWGYQQMNSVMLGEEEDARDTIFFGLGRELCIMMDAVQPSHVANAIDHCLKNGGINKLTFRKDVRPPWWHRIF